jgi:short subunit dehydrogenase-like uncharacterized protein
VGVAALLADPGKAESLAALARGTRVVATMVGPYRREGLSALGASYRASRIEQLASGPRS